MVRLTEDSLQRMLINPFYATRCTPQLTMEHAPPVSEVAWVQANAPLLQEIRAEQWLTQLLNILEGNATTAEDSINPYNVITIYHMFAVEHPPMVTREQWVQANILQIRNMGAEGWLKQLLDVLERNFVTAEDVGFQPSPATEFPRYRSRRKGKGKRKHKK